MESENNTNNLMPPDELKKSLAEKVQGLLFPSESDRPIEVVADPPESASADPEQNSAQNNSAGSEISFEDFYQKYGVEKDWQNSAQKEFAAKFGAALALLRDHTSNIRVVRRGQVEVTITIIGQTQNGARVGLQTVSVETGE